jgi:hypothetical protein
MCIACEIALMDMLDALEPETRERILREQAARFACEVPEVEPQPAPPPAADEQKS